VIAVAFWWIFPTFFLGLFLLRVLFWPRWGWCGWGYAPYPVEPREELRQRLARGDITPEEYERRAALLK
jgi:uncharacterized membrane protein